MKTLSVLIGAYIILFFSSCESCMTCTYTEYKGAEITTEVCGNGEETGAFADEIEKTAEENRSKYYCSESR